MRIRPEGGLTGKNASPTLATASGMWTMHDVNRNIRNGIWPLDTGQADPYFNLNTMLIHADGSNSANNNTIIDSSTDKIPFTGTYSALFDGTSSYVTVPAGSGFAYGTGDFTVEAWVYATSIPDGTSGALIWSQTVSGTNYFMIGVSPAGRTSFTFATSGGGTGILGPATNIVLNTWNHVAVVRNSGLVTVYLNGVGGTATSCTQNFTDTSFVPTIGRYTHSGSIYWAGYISNVRVVKGTAVYTSNFTPPTSALTAISGTSLLTLQSSTFIDNSASALTVTSSGSTVSSGNYPVALARASNPSQGTFSPFSQLAGYWSNYFNGSAYHTLPAFNIGTGDFTIECWFNSSAVSSTEYPVFKLTGTSQFLEIRINTAKVQGRVNDGATIVGGNTTITAGTWYHVALVRSSGVDRLYINGVVESTTANDTTNYSFSSGRIAANQTPNIYYTGLISNFRIVIGTAVYTSNFTVPTAPLSTVSGTSTYLLACQNNGFNDSSVNNTTVTPTSVQVSALSPFAPSSSYLPSDDGASYSFNGSTDYARIGANITSLGLGTGDFTIECWCYFYSVASGFPWDLRTQGGGGSQTKPTLYFSASGSLTYFNANAARITTTGFVTGRWYHIAIVRSSNVTRFYTNGVVNATTYSDTSDYGTTGQLTIGSTGDSPGAATTFLSGHLTDLRVTKSAVYTGAFTPPTAPLAPITNTTLLLNGTNGSVLDQTGKCNLSTFSGARLSTTLEMFGPSSLFFNGSSDYISLVGTNNSFAFGAGDFTIEMWVYFNSVSGSQTLFDQRPAGTSANANYATLALASGTLNYYTSGGLAITGNTPNAGQWYHVAVVRSGTSTKLYVDGTQRGSTLTDSQTYINGANRPIFGADGNNPAANFLNGYLDEVRVTRYARYTTTFTPTSQPFLDR